MEMSTAEFASVNGVACDVLDAQGRLVITPNALTLEGQANVPADLRPGESLAAFLARHVPGIASGAWAVSIGGRAVPQAMWARTYPKHGQLIACRCTVRKTVLPLIAMLALTYFTMGAGAGWIASSFGVTAGGTAAALIGAGLFVAGSLIINKVLGPKVPKPGDSTAREVYSLSSQRNSVRAYEPLPVLWGEMRVTPDLASLPYTWYEGDDQYLSTILLGGVNVHSVADLSVGDTPIASYSDVSVYYNGFPGMASQDVPLYSNADTITGGDLENNGAWVTRTSSAGCIALQVDIEGQLFDVNNKGGILVNTVPLFIESRPVGGAWAPAHSETLSNASTAVLRRTITLPVAAGQHEVRVRLGQPLYNEGEGKDDCKLAWTVLKSIQPDATDYSAWGRIGIKIKATGQLSGALDTLRATYRARPLPVWTGATWATATTREEGLSNPGAIILQTLRGVYANGVLQFGFGLSDAQIDIEGLKAFMLHCAARGYTYDRWITGQVSLGAFCDEVALAGMGQFTWTDGSRPTVSFVGSGQPISGVVNMANMLKGSFSVAYNLSNAADGIEYQYLDRARGWETQTLRVAAPGVVTMLNPARISGDGVTTEAHAAVMARYHLAQSLYQYKTIDFGADIEHLDYRRLSVLSLSHDMTQWGFGGRVVSAQTVAGKVVLTLDESVPALPTRYVGLRVPGARDYRVFAVEAFAGDTSNTITLVGAWPADMAFPGAGINNPAHDTLWCYDFKATPGYRVRVVSIEPEADLKGARVSCVPEGPEFWDYVLNGSYTPAPGQSSLPQLARPSASNLRISEQVNVQGDTEWYELHAVWDATGDYDHAQVWAGRDGSELRLVDGNAVGSRSTFRIDGAGEWLVEVRPFNTAGLVGQSATALYITTMTQRPPRNVDQFVVQSVAGGLRRFAWQYVGDSPPAFAGVQIRYVPGDVPLSVADWDGMQPLGEAADVYRAQFETTRPEAGQWTFGVRAIDTAGRLSPGVLRFATSLGDNFEQVQQPDLTPPPTPTGFTVDAGISYLLIGCDPQTYSQGRGHLVTRLYGATWTTGDLPVFADATVLAEFQGTVFSHPTNPATTWHLWITWVTRDGVESPTPAGGTNGLVVTSGQDVSSLLDALTGQITQSQLYGDLGARIDLIDGNGPGSVNARLIDEANARGAAITAEQSARQTADTSLAQQITTVQATVTQSNLGKPLPLWNLNGQSIVTLTDGKVGSAALRLSGIGGGYPNQGYYVPIDQSKQYRARFWARPSSNSAGVLYFSLRQFVNNTGTAGPVNGGRSPYKPSGVSRAQHNAAYGTDQWGEYSFVWSSSDWQSGVKFVLPEFLDNYSGAAGHWDIQDFTFTEVTATENLSAAVQTETTARAAETGQLFARYTVKVDVNGYVAGFGLASTANGATPTSSFAIRADAFYIANPTGPGVAPAMPFIVRTTPVTINGVEVPVGVYMSDAFIQNGTITNAKIANLAVDDAKIANLSVSKLDAGSLKVGSYISSSNYVSGSQGFAVWATGAAEFNNVTVRGAVYATAGYLQGVEVRNSSGAVLLSSGNTLQQNMFGPGGKITKSNASTYIEDLAVDTLQLAGNAVTLPVGALLTSDFYTFSTTPVVALSTYIESRGAPIFVSFEAALVAIDGNENWQNQKGYLVLLVNGVEARRIDTAAQFGRFTFKYISAQHYIQSPGFGTTIQLAVCSSRSTTNTSIHTQWYQLYGGEFGGTSLFAIGTKR